MVMVSWPKHASSDGHKSRLASRRQFTNKRALHVHFPSPVFARLVPLGKFGLRDGAPNDRTNLSEKWEGMGLMPALDAANPNDFFFMVVNDNDFLTTNGFQVGVTLPRQD